jgi:hypothetical protein
MTMPDDMGYSPPALAAQGMPMGLALMFDDRLFAQAMSMATVLSKAEGFMPPHLIGKPNACFAVVTRALTWKLDPFAVAQCTYQTPGGRVGYEGKLVQSVLENSGKLEGPVKYEHFGPWENVKGKFQIKKSERGKDFAVPTWTRADAKGCGVIVRAQVKGEMEPRELKYDLDEAFPLNSTLWATKPWQQICYTAVRAFANLAAPGLFMGVPFDDEAFIGPERARDVTPPRPTRADFADHKPEPVDVDPSAAGHEDLDERFRQTVAHDETTGEISDYQAARADGASSEGPHVKVAKEQPTGDSSGPTSLDADPAVSGAGNEYDPAAEYQRLWDGAVAETTKGGRTQYWAMQREEGAAGYTLYQKAPDLYNELAKKITASIKDFPA